MYEKHTLPLSQQLALLRAGHEMLWGVDPTYTQQAWTLFLAICEININTDQSLATFFKQWRQNTTLTNIDFDLYNQVISICLKRVNAKAEAKSNLDHKDFAEFIQLIIQGSPSSHQELAQ